MLIDVTQVESFTLIFIRLVTSLAVLPVFSHAAAPSIIKAGIAAVIALLVTPAIQGPALAHGGTVPGFALLAVRESLCGILIGLAGQFLFYAVDVAGQLIGFQSGFSMVASIDPMTESQSTVITQLYNLVALLLFLSLNGHHLMLSAVVDSLKAIPLGGLSVDGRFQLWTLDGVRAVMANGIRLAAPLILTLLLTDVGLGILSRIAPAMNIFVLGFPLKIGITLGIVAMTIGIVVSIFNRQLMHFANDLPGVLRLLRSP